MEANGSALKIFRFSYSLGELRVVVARKAHGGLRQIVGAEAEELGLLGDLVGGQRRARNLDHGADQVMQVLHAGLRQHFLGDADHDVLLVLQFARRCRPAES